MMRFAVIGDPISHTLSPPMQNAGIKALGIDGTYEAVHVTADELGDFAERARKEFDGFNITVPHKKAIIPYLDEVAEYARLAESVNTVTIRDGRLIGDSTDGYGLATGIKEAFDIDVKGNEFCFIGCGGAVQAVAFYFAEQGASGLSFINRTVSKAEALVERLKAFAPDVKLACCGQEDPAEMKALIDQAAVVVQGTSLGLKPEDPTPVPAELIDGTCFYDTIYKNTGLLQYARGNGIKCADGRTMLLHQGVKSLSIWTGMEGPTEAMREALYSAIEQRT